MNTKKFVAEMLEFIFYGVLFGIVGLVLGAGESRTGRYSGVEPAGCWLVAFGLGIYAWHWMRKPVAYREAGLGRGFVRAITMLLPVAVMSLQATGMVDLTYDSGPDIPLPFKEQALQASAVYGFWLLGILASAIVAGIIAVGRGIGRLITNRAVA